MGETDRTIRCPTCGQDVRMALVQLADGVCPNCGAAIDADLHERMPEPTE